MFLSRNTIKTQAISIYRKLGVSSRTQALEKAAELGLLSELSPLATRPAATEPAADGSRTRALPSGGQRVV
jgi:LuxR family maltose regulon positive regulatory protein